MAKFTRKTKEERKQEIREAAMGVFLEKGFKYTTMEDIIAKTTLSKGGVYRYYASTKEMMFDMMELGNQYRFMQIKSSFEKLVVGSTKEQIVSSLVEVTLNKILEESNEKQLYLMFLYETLYEEEFREKYNCFEKQSMEFLKCALTEKTGRKFQMSEENQNFSSQMINALIMGKEFFPNRKGLEENKERLEKLFAEFFRDCLLLG